MLPTCDLIFYFSLHMQRLHIHSAVANKSCTRNASVWLTESIFFILISKNKAQGFLAQNYLGTPSILVAQCPKWPRGGAVGHHIVKTTLGDFFFFLNSALKTSLKTSVGHVGQVSYTPRKSSWSAKSFLNMGKNFYFCSWWWAGRWCSPEREEEASWKSGHMLYSFFFFSKCRLFLLHLLQRRGHINHKIHDNWHVN